MWDFMQMVLPGEGYWTHYHTNSLLNEPFTDQNGNPTKWSIKYSNETAQGHGYPNSVQMIGPFQSGRSGKPSPRRSSMYCMVHQRWSWSNSLRSESVPYSRSRLWGKRSIYDNLYETSSIVCDAGYSMSSHNASQYRRMLFWKLDSG